MTDLPAPLVPAEVDLRDFAFMPLDVVRLRDSGLTAKASGDEFRAAVLLWCASWHQVPSASLPDDDDELASICGYSRARREWTKVREGARRGWLKCDDGRLYHARVAVKALEAWIEKLASAIGGATGNAKRWNVEIDTDAMRAQFVRAVERLRALDPQSRTLRKKVVAVLTMPSRGESPPDNSGDSPPDSPPDRKGQGQGQGQGLDKHPSGVVASKPRPTRKAPADFALTPELRAWAAENAPLVDASAELAKMLDHTFATARTDWPGTLRNWLRKAQEDAQAKPKGRPGAQVTDLESMFRRGAA